MSEHKASVRALLVVGLWCLLEAAKANYEGSPFMIPFLLMSFMAFGLLLVVWRTGD